MATLLFQAALLCVCALGFDYFTWQAGLGLGLGLELGLGSGLGLGLESSSVRGGSRSPSSNPNPNPNLAVGTHAALPPAPRCRVATAGTGWRAAR
eukprot:scaffold77473_cov96-Phaeocystis_antarctica.AAC.1